MTQTGPTPSPTPQPRHRAVQDTARLWGKRAIIAVVLLVLVVLAYVTLAATIPRWWSQRVGSAVNGHLATGGFLGVLVGLACTLVPLIFLWIGLHRHRAWQVIVVWVVLAVVVALPNLFTLGVVLGRNNGAHAGQRIMDVDAPWFRGGSLVGAIVGLVVFLGFLYFTLGRRDRHAAPRRAAEPSDG